MEELDPTHQLLQICSNNKEIDNQEILSLIEKKADVNYPYDKGGKQRVEFYSTKFKIKKELFDKGTALQISSYNGHLNVLNILLQSKADISSQSDQGYSSLFYAAQNGNVNCAKFLIENGAEVDQISINLASPLYVAAQNGHAEMIKLLASSKANINNQRDDNSFPLYIACEQSHVECVKQILSFKGDCNMKGYNGYYPYQIANNQEIIKMLSHPQDVIISNLEKIIEELRVENQNLKHIIHSLNINSSGQQGSNVNLNYDSSIEMFLIHLQLSKYYQLFETEGFSLVEDLEGITYEDFITIGISNSQDIKKILSSFNSISK
eukprot:TRINITY_DN4947_c1_g1_i1.p1 TRINITY_DN4947_c1_g1~~TRINITY_DN4947_c1_g1_i1.p1  ORF type:complete len:322 (+),score=72.24 TRINITY_DN4947_c1_g1_i1:131-1096(+)